MADLIKNLQSQMAEQLNLQLIWSQKFEGQCSQMLMMLQNIHQELLKKSFNFSPNSDLNANTENHQEFLQITPNSFPNSNSNPSSKNNPSKSFGYVPKLDFSVFDGTNSENPQADEYEGTNQECLQITPNSLPHLNSNPCSETHPPKSEDSSKSVSQENDTREPILFTAISVCLNGNKVDQGFEEKIYVRGKTEDSLHKLYEPVKVWEFADKPRICYEECRRTLFIALNFVNILKWKLGLHGKFVWYKLSKILDVLEEKPPPHDLVVHKHLREAAVEHDEGDGTGVAESAEWLWEIIWRFDGIFEGFEHLPESFDVMASMLVDEGMIREAQLWLSVAEMRVTTLDQNMVSATNDFLLQSETTCGSLLYELQKIWDEVGNTDSSRDEMLSELEQECLEVYKRKVDQVNRSTAQLRQAIADSEAELVIICSVMGELPVNIWQTFFERLDIPLLWEMHLGTDIFYGVLETQ